MTILVFHMTIDNTYQWLAHSTIDAKMHSLNLEVQPNSCLAKAVQVDQLRHHKGKRTNCSLCIEETQT